MPRAGKTKKGEEKFYAVKVGRIPGVYRQWVDAEAQVKGFPGAAHKSFNSIEEANTFSGHYSIIEWTTVNSAFAGSSVKNPITVKEENVEFNPRNTNDEMSGELAPISVVARVREDAPVLSPQQQEILEKILDGENYFFTGSAGTGKSVLLRAIIKAFKKRKAAESAGMSATAESKWQDYLDGLTEAPPSRGARRWNLGVTASTGMAGVNIGGTTVHSWAGIGLGKLPVGALAKKIQTYEIALRRWQETDALIIDEISMVDGALFDKLEELARIIRRNEKPFGGIQLIVSGDFFQLPPISKPGEPDYKFAFESSAWPKLFPHDNMSGLTRVFRQKEDAFVKLLESMRKGIVRPQDLALLKRCARKVVYADNIEPVGLYPSKVEVANINDTRLAALDAPLQQYISSDVAGVNSNGYKLTQEQATELLNRNTIWPQELNVKVGAMVMLVTNMQDGTLANGSTGIIVDFMTGDQARKSDVHIPLKSVTASALPEIAWPVVEFIRPKHATGPYYSKTLIAQMSVEINNAQTTMEAERHQVPLILAWQVTPLMTALTIHKSQGQTIERVRIDVKKVFVEGQTYVAISRAVSLDTLEIRNFAPNKVMAHKRVIEWARPLEDEQAKEEEWDDLMANHDFDETT